MWKIARILIILALITGLTMFSFPPVSAWDMSAVSVNVTLYVTPLVAPTITNGIGASNVAATTARLNGEVTDTGNENPTAIVYSGLTDGGTNPAAWDDNVTLGVKALGAFYHDASGLSETTLYYYRMFAQNSGGSDWADSSENFTTIALFLPPSDFTLTDLGAITITANWTTGIGSTYTMIRASRSAFPASPTDGELVYYGDATSTNSTGWDLDVTTGYFSAWGYQADNVTYSATYATANIGGEGMTGIADALESLSTAFTTIGGYIEYGIGVFFILTIFAIAVWRRDLVTYMISGLLAFFIAVMWLDDYLVISLVVMFLAVYQWFESLVIAMSSGGTAKGISQFKGVIDTFKEWF